MAPSNRIERKKMLWKFAGLYAVAILLIAVIIFSFVSVPVSVTQSRNNTLSANSLGGNSVLRLDKTLHTQFNDLMNLKAKQFLSDTIQGNGLVDIKTQIAAAEQILQQTIDSAGTAMKNAEANEDRNSVDSLLSSFKTAFMSLSAIQHSETHITTAGSNTSGTTEVVARLQREIQMKDATIRELQNKAQIAATRATDNPQQQNKVLKEQLAKNERLVNINNTLRKNIEQLNKRIEALKKFNNGSQ